ncbi:hypothetical protein MML48_7g00015405 [Holotrichia oblita]|uniref:Uncharacterized protein n=1 Tax=Holotrichia oblita TaxID=644536 RepID=A0ACB9SUV7_HOLOL|nr:hypothetical protein MML48_7g00015405 [Holotrichia oblita]
MTQRYLNQKELENEAIALFDKEDEGDPFYSSDCIRHSNIILCHPQSKTHRALSTQQNINNDEYVYYQGVQGKPGIDFPVYSRIPRTSFSCKKVESGYYADLDTNCQVFHICNGGAKISFLCPNGTIFQQSDLICEWWFKVNCTNSPNFYSESAEQLREESWKRKSLRKSDQNRDTSVRKKPPVEQPRRNEISNNINNKVIADRSDSIPSTRNGHANNYESSRTVTEGSRRKQVNGNRGGRKFKQNNLNVRNELTENDANSDEAQVPQETASFYKNNQNTIQSSDKPTTTYRYPNHKETYSEVQQPKFYSTKPVSSVSQTSPPQTYSTNRIPLNDGKPFVVSTPKSVYNIQINGFSGTRDIYSKATTESFRYSPTVPPFTTAKKSQPTTVIPKIIVDADTGSEANDGSQINTFSTISPEFNKLTPDSGKETQYNSQGNYGTRYTTQNSLETSNNHKGISFTERINTFSGLDDIIHTPTTNTNDHNNVQVHSVTSSGTKDSHSVGGYEITTKDTYRTSTAASTKYGSDYNNSPNTPRSFNKIETGKKTTTDDYYKYTIQFNTTNDLAGSTYDSTTKDSYLPAVTKSSTAKYGTEVASQNSNKNIVSVSGNNNQNLNKKDDYLNNGLLPNRIDSSKLQTDHVPSVYDSANENNLAVSSRNVHTNSKTNIPNGSNGLPTDSNTANFNQQNSQTPKPNAVQRSSVQNNVDTTTNQPGPESSYGDACGDDIVYSELPQDQIVVGRNKIVIDETTVPTTEINRINITVNNINSSDYNSLRGSTRKELPNSTTDSTIFRINLKYGDKTNPTEKPNGFFVTKQFNNNHLTTSHTSTAFSSGNTYLPKQTSPSTTFGNNFQTKSNTYLPKQATPAPFSFHGQEGTFGKKETNIFPQFINVKENHQKTSAGVPQISDEIQQAFALKPKPFELPPRQVDEEPFHIRNSKKITSAPLPEYEVSSARPFALDQRDYEENTVLPTLATSYPPGGSEISEHLRNMLNTLKEIVNERNKGINNADTPRPGLLIPPSVGPQTLHTLAVYFANALDNVSTGNGKSEVTDMDETQAINQLLTHSTINRYHELFKDGTTTDGEPISTTLLPEEGTEENNDLEGQHSKTPVTPRVQQLAQVFTKALSSYLDDPETFKKVLEEARPTEPPTSVEGNTGDDEELLNYSDADIKPNLPRLSTTTTAAIPTWGYILAPNNTNSYEYNSLNGDGEHLQSSDSQSFATQFNNYIKEKHFGKGTSFQSTTPINEVDLPTNHWTSSVNATKLWKDNLYTNPQSINEDLNVSSVAPVDSRGSASTESSESSESSTTVAYEGINYSVTNLPKMELNSTQVHNILVDIINSTRDEGNKLKRILHKLNTTQEDFLNKMREIEQNPLTRRLILLLISECGSNITHLENNSGTQTFTPSVQNKQTTNLFDSSRAAEKNKFTKGSSPFPVYVDPSLKDEDEDNRALQLLNSLYTIAAKYGK